MSEHEIVLVTWRDVYFTGAKFIADEIEAIKENVVTPTVFTPGFKITENESDIWIAQNILDDSGEEQFDGVTVIPRSLIRQIKHLDTLEKQKMEVIEK